MIHSFLLEISRRSRKMSRRTLTCIAVACLSLAAIFFVPWLVPEANTQITSGSGVVFDDEGLPVAHPSKLLGTILPRKVDLRKELPPVADQGDAGSQAALPLPLSTTR